MNRIVQSKLSLRLGDVMLIGMLLVVLIAVILFREEIRFVLWFVGPVFLAYTLWDYDPWGRWALIAGGLVLAGAIYHALTKPVAGPSPPPAQAPASNAPAAEFNSWYYADNGRQYGPVTEQQLLAALAARQLAPDTPIRCGINPAWNPAKQLWAGRF